MGAGSKTKFERVIVDTTVQSKAIAHPPDSRFPELARDEFDRLAKRAGIELWQAHEHDGKPLRRRAGGYAHAKRFKRLRAVHKRQRTILGRLLREVRRKMDGLAEETCEKLDTWVQSAERILRQPPKDKDKDKLHALHATKAECIGKGKARQPYEVGVKVSLTVTHQHGQIVGARSFPGDPYHGHTPAAQIEQATNLLRDIGVKPAIDIVDLDNRGVDKDVAPVEVIDRGKFKSLGPRQRAWLKRCQAIEPLICHTKADHRMDRCWLKGAEGDALHAALCAASTSAGCCGPLPGRGWAAFVGPVRAGAVCGNPDDRAVQPSRWLGPQSAALNAVPLAIK